MKKYLQLFPDPADPAGPPPAPTPEQKTLAVWEAHLSRHRLPLCLRQILITQHCRREDLAASAEAKKLSAASPSILPSTPSLSGSARRSALASVALRLRLRWHRRSRPLRRLLTWINSRPRCQRCRQWAHRCRIRLQRRLMVRFLTLVFRSMAILFRGR